MSRVHRLRRHVGQSAATHERARGLAATRVDWPLDPVEAAWLEAHLGSCEACRSIAAEYDADSLALRAMRDQQPVPPRDLWARTSAAIERESVSRGGRSRRATSPGRRAIPLGALSGVAVIAVVIGASVLSGGFINGPATGGAADGSTPPIAVVPTSGIARPTPIAVGVGSVEWLGTSSNGGLAYSSTKIDKVCATDLQPECEPVNDNDSKSVDLTITPKSISQSPVKSEVVVVGTDAAGDDTVVVMALPTPNPTATPVPPPTETPTATPEPADTAVPSESATAPASGEPTTSDVPSTEPSTAPSEPAPPPPSVEPSVEPTPQPTPVLTPEPTV